MSKTKGPRYFNVVAEIEGDCLVLRVDLRRSYGLTGGNNLGIAKTGHWPMQLPGGEPREDGLAYNLTVSRALTPSEAKEHGLAD